MTRVLVTAGNTQTPIDAVRCITNVFSGKTGAAIAGEAKRRGHDVTLLTSHPEIYDPTHGAIRCVKYQTFDDLAQRLEEEIRSTKYDVVIHAAAVSDYRVAGTFAPSSTNALTTPPTDWPALQDVGDQKLSGSMPELWLRLVPAPKLVDRIRQPWGFAGLLVKFKLEVGISDAELIQIADASRRHSQADLLVANTYEGRFDWALILDDAGVSRIDRPQLASALWDRIEPRLK